jgi:alpha-beta hydrolase superfamily lysophospholipase
MVRRSRLVDGLVICSPAFGVKEKVPRIGFSLLSLFAKFFPKLRIVPPPRGGGSALSRLPDEQRKFDQDVACWHGSIGARMARELASASADTEARLNQISIPTLMIWGAADTVISPESMKRAAGRIRPELLTQRVWPLARHHLLVEVEKENVIEQIKIWLAETQFGNKKTSLTN